MTAPKPGDRVHVEYEAVVLPDGYKTADDIVVLDYEGGATHYVYVKHCTVIVPPINIGDVVTEENVGQLTAGSVVAWPGCDAQTLDRSRSRWWLASGGVAVNDAAVVGATVLRVGDGS